MYIILILGHYTKGFYIAMKPDNFTAEIVTPVCSICFIGIYYYIETSVENTVFLLRKIHIITAQ